MSRGVFVSLGIVFLTIAVCSSASADDVIISGASTFASLDGSATDHDGLVNGVFTVSDGNLTILGTVTCLDDGPGSSSACPMQFMVSGDLTLTPGSGLYAENRRAQGSGGTITLRVGGDLVLAGSSLVLPGAVISSDSFGNDAGGSITFNVLGSSTLGAGSAISAASAGGNAGAISLHSGGPIVAAGLVASGPGRLTSPSTTMGKILTGGSSNQRGGAITLASTSHNEPAVTIIAGAVVVSQGENNGSGHVRVDGCGVEVRGLVASNANGGTGSAVSIRSGTTLVVDGTDLGSPGLRRGQLRAASTGGDASTYRIRVLARNSIQVFGPISGSVSAITTNPGGTNSSGGTVEVLSTDAGITMSGTVIHAGDTQNGRSGGAISIAAKNSLNLDGSVLRAVGDNPANNEHGGAIAIRSYSGAVSWQNGVGDVRPTGSAAGVPAASHGTISFTYCTTLSTNGTSFPVNGSAVGLFPTTASSCSPAAPALPPGESLPDCNDPPIANPDAYGLMEGGTLNVGAPGVLTNDVEPDGQPMTAALVSGPAHGTVSMNPDGSFIYTHDGSETNTDQFTYTASDGSLTSNVATVTITITPVNDAPVAENDAYAAAEGGTLNVAAPGLLANDQDPDGPAMTALLVSSPSHGTLTLNPDGSFIYTHDGSETTSDSFTYKANDTVADSNVATVSINVTPVNDAPVANNDSYSVAEGGTLAIAAPGVLANDTDPDSSITAVLVTGPAHGTLSLQADGSFTYVHDGGESTSDAFSYRASDGPAVSNVAAVTISVTAVNDAPVATNDAYDTTEGGTLAIPPPGVIGNDTDADSASLTAVLVSGPAHGTLTLSGDGSFTYLHDGSETTSDSFTYQASDGAATSNVATVTIAVAPANDAPVASDDSYTVAEGDTLSVTAPGVLGNDADTDSASLSASLVSGPSHGTLTLNADGSFAYAHDGSETTADTFSYSASDGTLSSNVATVTISISPVNDAPAASDDSYSTSEGATLNVPAPGVLGNDTDTESDALNAVLASGPSHGTLTLNANGSFSYVHDGSETTSDSFSYKASDGAAESNVATVTLNIAAVNDAPAALDDAYGVAEGGTLNLAGPGVLGNDSDPDGAVLTAVLVSGPAHGTLVLNADGSFTYVHDGGETASDFFTYRANDGALSSNIATVAIAITPINDAPVANPDSYNATFNGTLNVPAPGVLGNDTDPDSSISAILVTPPANGTLTLNANGSFTYVHNGIASGVDTFTYKANDGTADSNVTTVTLTVVAQPPAANDDFFAAVGNTERRVGTGSTSTPAFVSAGSVLANDTDPDTPPAALTVTAFDSTSTAGGTVSMLPNGAFNYLPPVGFTGNDTFSYTVSDGLSSDTGTVTMGVANRVWYVNNAATPGDGRSTTPFGTLATAEAASAANDFIYVHRGDGTTSGQSAGIVLKFAQQLIGEGVALVVGGNTLHSAGTPPTLGHASGNAVRLGNGNTVAGFRITASANGINGNAITAGAIRSVEIAGGTDAIRLTGTAGTFTISDVALTPGAAGLVIDGGTPAITASNLDITTTSGTGILGTGTGSFTTSAGSTVTATAGKALDITDMTVDITLAALNAAAANTGVSLQNTSGRFVVVPDGPGSAGTIQNTLSRGVSVVGAAPQQMIVRLSNLNILNGASANGTAASVCGNTFTGTNLGCNAGIHLENVQELLLSSVVVDGSAQIGVNGNNVSAVTFDNVTVANAGTETFEHGVQFVNLSGTSSVTNSTFSNNFHRQFTVQNSSGTLSLSVTGSTFNGTGVANPSGAQGVLISGNGTANITASVQTSIFTNNFSTGYFSDGANSATLEVTVADSTFTANGGGGVTLGVVNGAMLTYDILNNVISGGVSAPVAVLKGSGSFGNVSGTIAGNTLGLAGVPASACSAGSCDGILLNGNGSGTFTVAVDNNTIRNFTSRGIALNASETVQANAAIRNNIVSEPGPSASSGVFSQSGVLSADTSSLCADIQGNAISGVYAGGQIRVRNRFAGTSFRLPGYAGAGNDTTAVAAFISGQNGGATATATINANTFGGGAACVTP